VEASVGIQLRWRDMDMLGHLNQSVYHELLEEGRAELFGAVLPGGGFPFVLARVELDHHAEVRRDHGTVEVVARVLGVGRTSVTVENEILLPDGTPAATGRAVLVAWDVGARRSRSLTDDERASLNGA
jgi:acyl-CoA thioester hydrolase